jgi:hypothetical protein
VFCHVCEPPPPPPDHGAVDGVPERYLARRDGEVRRRGRLPHVQIEGEEKDWIHIGECFSKIADLFKTNKDYFNKVKNIITDIIKNCKTPDSEFWKKMFYMERCGSGSQVEAFGWFTDLFVKEPEYTRFVSNFSTHVSSVNYTNLNTGRKFQMKQGLLYSEIQDDFFNPEFGCVVVEEIKESVVQKVEEYKEDELNVESETIKATKRKLDKDWTFEELK